MLTIYNAQILTPFEFVDRGTVMVENGRISHIGSSFGQPGRGKAIDACGGYLVPGFIDLQVNGGFGLNFTEDPNSIWQVAPHLPQSGVTSFLPTIVTSPIETVAAAQEAISQRQESEFTGAAPLGLHVEGPFLNPQKKGAHKSVYIRPPDLAAIAEWSRENSIWLVTLAPELRGALALVERLVDQGVVVSAGHTMATYEEAQAGFNSGIRYGTHLFNAMRPLTHRDPGIVGALLQDEECTAGLICDGIHVHPAMVDLAWKAKGSKRLNLVSDATTALDLPPGSYRLGDRPVNVTDSDARLADGTLAGSMAPLDQGLRNLISYTGITLQEALPTVTSTPAELMGIIDHRGHLAAGKTADMVLLSPDLQVHMTIAKGRVVYQRDQH